MSRSHRVDYLPTPRQIVAECAAIRLLWTPAERRRRVLFILKRPGAQTPPAAAINLHPFYRGRPGRRNLAAQTIRVILVTEGTHLHIIARNGRHISSKRRRRRFCR